jgi:hypothetical protein
MADRMMAAGGRPQAARQAGLEHVEKVLTIIALESVRDGSTR